MSKVKNVEKRIWDIEGFDVRFMAGGRDVRGDKEGLPQYNTFERAARNDWTVKEWKEKRFSQCYPGYDVEILDGDGEPVPGQTKLGTVRDTYVEDDEN
ncbi:hypothetical protein ACE1BS_21620 [Aeromonas jandaei]